MDADTANFIARHQPSRPRDELAAQVDERAEEIEILKKTLERRPGNLVELAEEARALAGLRHWLQPDSAGIVSLLQLAARAIGASGASLGPNGSTLQVDLDSSGIISLPRGRERPASMSPRLIAQGFHAALATRDRAALDLLAAVPIDRTTRQPPSPAERIYRVAQAQGLQALLRGDTAGNQLLLDAIKGCNALELAPSVRDYAQFVVSPEIELTLLHRDPDPTRFDQALRNALVLHRRYWAELQSNPGESQDSHPEGFIALGPLAWVAMRHNLGLPCAIRSDYLPRAVIEQSGSA